LKDCVQVARPCGNSAGGERKPSLSPLPRALSNIRNKRNSTPIPIYDHVLKEAFESSREGIVTYMIVWDREGREESRLKPVTSSLTSAKSLMTRVEAAVAGGFASLASARARFAGVATGRGRCGGG